MRLQLRPRGVGRVFALALGLFVAATGAAAADRHVYLDRDGDGILNDCPNPAHNAQGTSTTTNLKYCAGGSSAGKIIGSASGRVTATACTTGGGTSTNLASGVLADVDGDGTTERVYSHPQACVYNMAKSDSCDVHSGTYWRAGAMADNYVGDFKDWGNFAPGTCQSFNCFYATVLAYGLGPNLNGTGYGTASAPGYLRGAVMNGATDTWDSDGDKKPDTMAGEPTSYPVIFDGNVDNDANLYEITNCTGAAGSTTCTGDAFNAVWVGCGHPGTRASFDYCKRFQSGGSVAFYYDGAEHAPYIDSDGNGSFDLEYGRLDLFGMTEPPDTSFLVIKDIEFQHYNGGNTCLSGQCGVAARQGSGCEAHIMLNGDGSSDGMTVDHIYFHNSDYSVKPSEELFWAVFADPENFECSGNTTLKNSYIVQNNEKVWNADAGGDTGCELRVHDNLFVTEVTSSRSSNRTLTWGYFKQVDYVGPASNRRIKVHRFYNNEHVVKNGFSYRLFDLTWGNPDCDTSTPKCPAGGPWYGTVMVYGSLFRCDASTASSANCFGTFYPEFPHDDNPNARWKFFNNTMDFTDPVKPVSTHTINLVVERNNAWLGGSQIHASSATTVSRASEFCTSSQPACTVPGSTSRSSWFNAGSYATDNPDLWEGRLNYAARVGGPLDGSGTCDPDGDGTSGVDYDGNGTNDLSWLDITGNVVSCSGGGATIDVGAVQSGGAGPGDTTPPNNVTGVSRTDTRP